MLDNDLSDGEHFSSSFISFSLAAICSHRTYRRHLSALLHRFDEFIKRLLPTYRISRFACRSRKWDAHIFLIRRSLFIRSCLKSNNAWDFDNNNFLQDTQLIGKRFIKSLTNWKNCYVNSLFQNYIICRNWRWKTHFLSLVFFIVHLGILECHLQIINER